jgi:hypothetical protein
MAAGLDGAPALGPKPVRSTKVGPKPTTGSLTDARGGMESFAGTASMTGFLDRHGNLVPVGSINGKLIDSNANLLDGGGTSDHLIVLVILLLGLTGSVDPKCGGIFLPHPCRKAPPTVPRNHAAVRSSKPSRIKSTSIHG